MDDATQARQLAELDAALLRLAGAEKDFKAEWGWQRYLVDGHMFAAFCRPGAEHAAPYADQPLLTLKCDPARSDTLRQQYSCILPGFYMDKRCWISVCLAAANTLPEGMLDALCADSYALVTAKLSKKRRAELGI